ncbi:MAG: glycosyltransferase family 4 protein [Bacteroidetes bacterium]|nr:glycosyltransferase family 4 protein [Bacteroidota bacterium]
MSIHLLQIATLVPLPLTDGGRVGIYYLSEQYRKRNVQIDYVAPRMNANDMELFSKVVNLHLVDIDTRYTVWNGFRSLFTSVPYNVYKYQSRSALLQLAHLVRAKKYDVIQAESLHMAYYAIELKKKYNIPIVLREHNFQTEIIRRYMETVKNPILKLFLRWNYVKMLEYEAKAVQEFDRVFTITPIDDQKLRMISPSVKSVVIPAGVDCERIYYTTPEHKHKLLFLINYDWIPNIDAYEYYCTHIHQLLVKRFPKIEVIVAGRGTEKILKRKLPSNVVIKGFIDDFNSLHTYAPIAIVPLRIGGGIRIKILELMAKGLAIVSTSIGAEGIEVQDGEHIFLADTPEEFTDKVVLLLNSPSLCYELGRNARKLVEEKYSWNVIGEMMYREVCSLL